MASEVGSATSGAKVGFLGLGIMGMPMAMNLVNKAGRELVVWNRDGAKSEQLRDSVKAGTIEIASSPKEVVSRCEVTFVMLSTPHAVHQVLLDMPDAAVHGVSAGKCIVDCSTITEADSRRSYDAVVTAGGSFLEAPVSGSKVPAENGALIFLAGGDRELFDRVDGGGEELLQAMGKKSVFLGKIGAGARMKLAVNMIMGSMIAALGEGIVLCERNELPVDALLDVLDAGAMANPMFRMKGGNMSEEKRNYAPHFPLEHAQKDMRFALQMGDSSNTSMPVAAAANECFKHAKSQGHARNDFSAVIEALRAGSVDPEHSSK
eukprot:CAMPEP_0185854294 /NCGR_PEP_ID=MMETSP1354-20130828/21905_1 /TAXON_ID=708628 /ORGANISM="Erythrolobus madagascarensis, Strain CCMP3276" /LENGTH=319 /DNA_ID=CAMNT_0028556019 /DNA_START=330 /DNA_END=1289 /DNA_ORIENTATION=-